MTDDAHFCCRRGFGAAAGQPIATLRSVIALWLMKAQVANEGLQIRKHGYGKLLRNMGLATAPQQASATFFSYTTRQFLCVVSQYQCAGKPSFQICNKYRDVVPPSMV